MYLVIVLSRVFVGLIFIIGGIAKAIQPFAFLRAIAGYRFVHNLYLLRILAGTVCAAETTVGTALVTGWLIPWSAILALGLLAAFTGVVTAALVIGRTTINCGCMTIGRTERIGWHTCFRNGTLACLIMPTLWQGVAAPMTLSAILLFGASYFTTGNPSHSAHEV